MLENFTKEEIDNLIKELKTQGYTVRENTKNGIIKQEAEKLGMSKPFIMPEISKPIYALADWATENYQKSEKEVRKSKEIPLDKEDEYRSIVSGILAILKPYYGRTGFCDRMR